MRKIDTCLRLGWNLSSSSFKWFGKTLSSEGQSTVPCKIWMYVNNATSYPYIILLFSYSPSDFDLQYLLSRLILPIPLVRDGKATPDLCGVQVASHMDKGCRIQVLQLGKENWK